MGSVRQNFVYSGILTTANYVFPLLVYPYASRVLGVGNIGLVNFIDSIINYFVLFSMMGIGTLGIREIAAVQGDKPRLRRAFSSLVTLNAVTTAVGVGVLAAATALVPRLHQNAELMAFGGFKLVFNFLLIEWLYKGLEDFRYVTLRTIAVKFLYVASVYVFVRQRQDFATFYLLTVLMVVVNAVVNVVHSRRLVRFTLHGLEIRRLVRPFLTLGVYMLLTSMYVTFNVAYLGFVGGDTQVGYYTTSSKIYTILIALFTAFTGVMLPRMSALVEQGRLDEVKGYLRKSFDFLVAMTMPMIVVTTVFAPQIVLLISGPGFEGAVTPMRIIMPLMFVIGYEQILVVQTLMPLKMDRVILRNSAVAAVVSVGLNVLLVGRMQCVGSALCWVACELLILVLSQLAVTRATRLRFPWRDLWRNVGGYVPLAALCWGVYVWVPGPYVKMLVGGVLACAYMLGLQMLVLRNELVVNAVNRVLTRR